MLSRLIHLVIPLTCLALHSQSFADAYPVESTCGFSDDSFYVDDLKLNSGVPLRLILERKGAVGALAISNVPGIGPKFCSGTLIGPDLFLTAAHCREAFAAKTYVSMNFEYTLNAPELKKEEFYEVESVLEDGFNSAPSLDYMILKLRGTPGLKYGSTPLRFFAPLPQERITIIQHPEGFPKKVHSGTVLEADHKRIKYSNLDTQGGSSGSGVLDSEGYLVGVHIQGGCWTYGGTNEAVSLEAITEKSRILRGILERSPQ